MRSSQKKILVDTNVYVGFYNNQDALHERATRMLMRGDEFVTTEHVFVEIMNVISRRAGVAAAIEAGKELLSTDIKLIQPLQHEFDEAWKMFASQKRLSFTDCVNIVLARSFGCDAIATFDEAYREKSRVPLLE